MQTNRQKLQEVQEICGVEVSEDIKSKVNKKKQDEKAKAEEFEKF